MTVTTGIEFFVPGRPAPQGSKRHVGRGVLLESSKQVGPWRERIAIAAHNAMTGRDVFDGAVDVALIFVMPRPVSTPKTRTPAATKKPDLDKLIRAVFDAITGVAIRDDSQVVEVRAAKRLAEIGEVTGAYVSVIA